MVCDRLGDGAGPTLVCGFMVGSEESIDREVDPTREDPELVYASRAPTWWQMDERIEAISKDEKGGDIAVSDGAARRSLERVSESENQSSVSRYDLKWDFDVYRHWRRRRGAGNSV